MQKGEPFEVPGGAAKAAPPFAFSPFAGDYSPGSAWGPSAGSWAASRVSGSVYSVQP